MKLFSAQFKIILIYLIFGFSWIIFSDNILLLLINDVEKLNSIQSYKGLLFIIITSILLYYLIKKYQNDKEKIDRIEHLLSSVFKVLPDILFILKDDGTVIEYQSQDNDKLYVQPEFFMNKQIKEVLPNDISLIFEKYLKETIKTKQMQIFDYNLEINKELKYFEARMTMHPNKKNIILIIRDTTENILRKQELKFQSTLLEQSLAATDVVDENGKFYYANSAYVNMWRYANKNEIIGSSPIEHYEDPTMPSKIISKIEKYGEHIFQFKAKRKDNTTFDVLMATKCIYFNNKKYYIGSSMDISERNKLLTQYESIFNNSKEGIFLHKLDGTIIDVNPYIEKLQGVKKDKIIGTNVANYFKNDKKIKYLLKKLTKNNSIKFETEIKKLDDSTFYALIESQILDFEGETIVQGTIKDLTDEFNNSLLLERSKNIFNNIEEGVMITTPDGTITEVNKSFEKITKYKSYEIVGKNVSILKSGKHDNKFYEKMWNDLKNFNKWSGKIYKKNKDQEIYTSLLTISTLKNKENKIQNYIGIFTDITELLNYEKELYEKDVLLVQQSKMASMGEMIENIAHQWKQPLGLINVSATGISFQHEIDKLSDENLEEGIKNIVDSVEYMNETINDFRNFLKPQKEKNEFSIENLFERVIRLTSSKIKNRNIQIVSEIENLTIFSIENELLQVIINIFNNAIDALEEKENQDRFIFIKSIQNKENISLSIKDNAGGIKEDIIDKIFDARFTTKAEGKGSGIGLYMSKNIISSLNGTIDVKNTEFEYKNIKYKGAEFIITLAID